MTRGDVGNALIAFVVCAVGGAIFFYIHFPLPWMLGALTASALAAIAGRRWFIPQVARTVARPVVGVVAGSSFGADILQQIPQWWDSLLLVLVQSLIATFLGYLFFRRCGGYSRETSFFCGAPGGLAEMSLMGAATGGDVRSIVVTHTFRIILVIFSMPFILQIVLGHPIGRVMLTLHSDAPPTAIDYTILGLCVLGGYLLARATNFAAGFVIFPLLLSAAVHGGGITQAVLPGWLLALVQVVIGGIVGARFAGIRWREMRRMIVLSICWGAALLGLAALGAFIGTLLIDRPFQALVLALGPGGMVEMTILTFSIGIEVAFVVTSQVIRILFVLLLVPVLYRLVARGAPPTPKA